MNILKTIRDLSGAKSVLALKCFSTWCAFDLMKEYMDGTTSSSLYEARLGYEQFGKEVHAYSVAFSMDEIREITKYSDKIIFNSVSQLKKFYKSVKDYAEVGLRINPGISYSHYDLADPARRYSRLGEIDREMIWDIVDLISGVMFHFNCENDDFDNFSFTLDSLSENYGDLLSRLNWVSLGGGIYFTKQKYPLKKFCDRLKKFADNFDIQVYLEPGEAAITESAELVTEVLDIVKNEMEIAIVDASVEAHMLDLLVYRSSATNIKESAKGGNFQYMIAGRSCLAGDIFGIYNFKSPLEIGNRIRISDAAGYTMVKKNWFNGLVMPSIAIKRLNGTVELIRSFDYGDFKKSLS